MTTQSLWFGTTRPAGADLTAAAALYKAIAVGGTIAGGSDAAFGLLQSKGKTGEGVTVGYLGEMKGHAGGAITAGNKVIVTTSGYLVAFTAAVSGAQVASGTVAVGKALETAASGDLFRGLFNFVTGQLG